MIKKLSLISMLACIFIACGGDSRPAQDFEVKSPKSCTQEGRNQFIYDLLKDSYYWSDKVATLDSGDLTTLDDATFLNKYRYQAKDVYSFVISKKVYNEHFVSGTSKDFGYRSVNILYEDNTTQTRIKFVFPDSAADKVGLKRSDIILGASKDASELHIKSNDEQERNVTLSETTYDVQNVLYKNIYTLEDKKVGYFLFQSFVGPNLVSDLNSVFSYFKSNNITDLVLDLRYNGGGSLGVSAYLGSLIGGENVKGHIFQYNRFNNKYSQFDDITYFTAIPAQSLHLKRLFILTTDDTVSASESLINALKARENGIEVISIGMDTFGKQYGMYTTHYCDKVLFPIQFSDSNSDGDGFAKGLKPTCKVQENFAHDFADVHETLLSEALFYIENGHCSR